MFGRLSVSTFIKRATQIRKKNLIYFIFGRPAQPWLLFRIAFLLLRKLNRQICNSRKVSSVR
jgi:hypothetical protein